MKPLRLLAAGAALLSGAVLAAVRHRRRPGYPCHPDTRHGRGQLGGVTGNRPVMVRTNGDFEWASGIVRGNGVLGGRVEIDGLLVGPRAHGHGTCATPRYSWRIRA
ncbi:MAG TPA: hypothetical protein VFR75_03380 [Solirubrobacterales bacterium]|nr:hypothetical protein [Solirubrobacterales bacterium]